MPTKAVYFLAVPGFADWEAAHALAELRRHGHYDVQAMGFTREPVQSMGGLTVQPTAALAELDPADVAVSITASGLADVEFAQEIMAELGVLSDSDRAYWTSLFRGGRLQSGAA